MFKKFTAKVNGSIEYYILLLVLLLTVIIKLFVLGNQLRNGIILSNTLDFSWQSDIIERLLHGYIAGRDFIITYGPLYQWITSLPSIVFKLPSYNGLLYAQILLYCIAIVAIFFIAKLLITNKKEQIILFLYILIILDFFLFPDADNLVRLTVPLLYSLLYLRYCSSNKKFTFPKIVLLAMPAITGLYVYDLFPTLLLVNIAGILFHFVKYKFTKTTFLQGFLEIGIIISFEILTSFLVSNNLNYIIYSLTTIRDYQFIENIPFSLQKSDYLLIYPVGMILAFIYSYRKNTIDTTNKKSLLILVIVAIIELKSAFFRTDEGHIIYGIYPSIVVLFIILYCNFRKNNIRTILILIFLLFYLFIPYKNSFYHYLSIANMKEALLNIKYPHTFFEIYKLPTNYYYTKNDFMYFSKLVKNAPGNVFVYPYDTYILNIFNQTYNSLPLQFYDYSNSIVEQDAVMRLRKSPPHYIILGIDTKGAIMLDNIPNFSRNPLIAKWMLSHYSIYRKTNTFLVLKFNPHKKSVMKRNDCSVYDINTQKIMGNSIFDIFKPSTYYLNSINIRLPFKPNVQYIFFIKDYNNSQKLSELFNANIAFTRFKTETKKNLVIIKKYPIPKIRHVFTDIKVHCYY